MLEASFSEGDFRSFSKKSMKTATATSVPVPTSVTEEPSADVSAIDSDQTAGVYSCPQDGCVRVFQRLSALERHLSLEKCIQSLERYSLMDLAKMGYKSWLEQGVGTLPTLKATTRFYSRNGQITSFSWHSLRAQDLLLLKKLTRRKRS